METGAVGYFLCVLAVSAAHLNHQVIEILSPLGQLRGSQMTSRGGRTIFAFRGVRYADPPVGPLRFKPPQPVKSWKDIFDASYEGPSCPQPRGLNQSEDCLRLNVYTTQLPRHDSVPKPVMVYFHPGGFYIYSGQTYYAGPEYLMDHDVVLVTVNYRLGSLGWISAGDSLLPGNLGLKDQVVALQWVRDNIASFSGDPSSVTIMGCSAGSRSVSLHLVSPMSKGLFHRAISMSGSSFNKEPLPTHQRHYAEKQAEILGCPTNNTEEIVECLRTKTAEEISGSLSQFREWYGEPILLWSPVVEPEVPGLDRFLPAQPHELLRQGKMNEAPLLAGITKDEFAGIVVRRVQMARNGNNTIFDDINANWIRLAPISFQYERGTERSARISKELRKYYLHDKPAGVDNYIGNGELYADSITRFPMHRLVKFIAEFSHQPVYYYRFSYQGRYSYFQWADGTPYGVGHQDDQFYLFSIKYFPYFNETSPEMAASKRLTTMWANFAKTGYPIPSKPDFSNVTWTPYNKDNQAYMDIGTKLVMKSKLNDESMKLWERLFPL